MLYFRFDIICFTFYNNYEISSTACPKSEIKLCHGWTIMCLAEPISVAEVRRTASLHYTDKCQGTYVPCIGL